MHISKALQYTENGYSVIPVDEKTKRPLIQWESAQTKRAEESVLEEWAEKYPNAGLGIVTGRISDITVVDIDVKHAERTPLETFPETYTVRTPSGGYHLYYQYSDAVHTCANQFPEYPYTDIRNDGGYVVAPPTAGYTVERAMAPQPFPKELFKTTAKRKRGLKYLTDVGSGGRNNSMASVIGKLLVTLPESQWVTDAYPTAVAINGTYKPPLPLEELKGTFESIAQAEKARREQSVPSPLNIPVDERITIQLRKNKGGVPYKDMVNVLLALQQHPLLKDKIKYNAFRHIVEYDGQILSEGNLLYIQSLIQDTVLPGVSKQIVDDAIQKHAFDNTYDEALDWVKSLQWDGVPRLRDWLPRSTYTEDCQYNRAIGAQWMLGMMRRLVHPGCVFDYVMVLVGPQGVGKTSLFRILGGEWYKSYSGGLDTKDFYLSLSGALIVDLDEGVTMYKSESIKMKSMITQTIDEYRAPYARRPEQHPRRFVFSMSTNDVEPFRDVTGNRRYWPLALGEDQIDFAWLQDNREQLFAEAYFALTNNIVHEEVPQDVALQMQEDRLPEDEWTETITDYLEKSHAYCTGSPDYEVTIAEIYEKALKSDIGRIERKHELRIIHVLRSLHLERRRVQKGGTRKYRYRFTPKRTAELAEEPITPSEHEF